MSPPALWRRFLAEFVGTALLVTAVVGSGVMATTLSPRDVGLQLLENSTATAFALGALILTFGLILLIFALTRSGRAALAPAAVGAYIGAAYWFTSSTSFANPAVTVGRAFTDTFAGIAPSSVPGFVIAQLVGLAVGTGLLLALYPDA
jgi:glycerol uptake facilitator-like aquaporin